MLCERVVFARTRYFTFVLASRFSKGHLRM
jgi:hypothetical protein